MTAKGIRRIFAVSRENGKGERPRIRSFVGIEREAEYVEIARARLAHAQENQNTENRGFAEAD